MSTVDLLQEIHHLRFATPDVIERGLLNAWRTYKVSDITRQLQSEAGREIYAEAIVFESADAPKTFYPKTLSELVVEHFAATFEGGSGPEGLTCQQLRDFGALLDVELPILQLLEVDNETFWKRVVKAKCTPMVKFHKYERDSTTNWKELGIELKVSEVIEHETPEYWFEGDLETILEKVQPFVQKLAISQLQPYKQIESEENYEEYKVYNPTPDLCSHGSLIVLKHLTNLTSLSLVFGLQDASRGYERRFFMFSLDDVKNLAQAMVLLPNLREFKISRSRMEPDKLKLLLEQLATMKIETLDLPYCYLGCDAGMLLAKYISKCPDTLISLNLSGNFLDGQQIETMGYGINVYQGMLKKLDISHNPIGEAGVLTLGGAIKKTKHVEELNVTGCEMGEQGAFRVVQLLGFHQPLRVLHMNCTPLGRSGGKKLIEVLKENWFVEEVSCKFCNLKPSHEKRIQSILRRNKKFKAARQNSIASGDSPPSPNGQSMPQ
ncbi:dynein regulatory complex subunit 5-like [Armigeres subalbatus]|uniref:dynein regulatory complex subunit 5-like n=1 Tax=Armigeres subalbatus TaxID=124917 RepID=UPI002ED3B654